uniref:Aciniform spidroin 1 variant 3 n=1 Tax=Araneus ventricosus TaxID=182803 RepID=A0A6M3YBY6_ARAVE|nr:aciniform spidroin 1 variant 3 [Araneus ventricosus]
MNWLTTLAFAVLLLAVQYDAVQSASPTFSNSPWANPAKANSFMNCLINRIGSSNVLPQQEKEDLESIMDTLMSAIKGASAKGKSSGAQLQAINMAVASSLAEIVVAEDVGNQASMAVKTQALSGALEQCFQAVMGTVDRKFISEINDLITMFAKQAATESNDIPDQGGFYAAGSSATSTFQATSQSFQGSTQTSGGFGGSYPGTQVSQPGPIGGGPQVSQPGPISVGPQISQPAPTGYTGGEGSYGGGALIGSVQGQTTFGQTSGFTSTSGTQGAFGQTTAAQSGLISRVANALANTSTMRTVLSSNVSRQTITTVVQRTIQTLARNLGLDANNLSRIALQAIAQVPAGSDTSAYTQAFSTALVTGGVLNASNIDTLGSQVLSALLNGVSTAAQGMGINVDSGSVQSDISSSSSFLSTSASSSRFSQTTGASSTTGYTGAGGYPAGPGPLTGGAGSVTAGQTSFGQTSGFTSTAGTQGGFGQTTGAQSALISRIANALANTSTLRAVLRAGVSQNVASNVVQRTIQTLASRLGIDGNSLSRVALQAISQIAPGSDTSAYAQALSTALVSGGVLNASNIDTLGSQVLSALLNGVSTAAQGMGINVDSGSVQSDISSGSSFLSTSASSSSFSQTTGASSTTGYTGAGGYPAGPGPLTGGAGSVTAGQTSFGQTSGFTSTAGTQGGFGQTTGAQSALISRIANALANTSTLRAVLRAGVSQNVASNVVQRTIQTLASRLGIDGNSLSRVALQAISQIAPGSDTSAYAQALSTALVSGGVLNASNIDTLGSQVLSALLNGVSTAAQGMGINVDSGSVQSDISSSSSFLSTSASSSSFSQTTGASSTTGYTGAGGYPAGPGPLTGGAGSVTAGQTSFGQTSGFTSTAGTQGGFGQTTGAQSALISRIANALANTSTLRAVLRTGVSQNVASNVVQRTIQTLASRLGIDGNSLSRVALQAISQIAPGSDTSAYAQALSTALVSGGVLNASNIDTLGSQVLSALLNGVSTAAQGMGINVDSGSVQSDISSSSSFLSTSASSSSFSQTTGASSTTGYTGAGGYPAGPGPLTGGAGSVTAGQTSFGQTSGFTSTAGTQGGFGQTTGAQSALISKIANALANTSTLRAVLRAGVSQNVASNVVQRTIQTLASRLGIDGNSLSRVALQAISQIAPGSDTSAYAQALSTALVSGGVLNASNIDTLGSQVLSALLNGVSTAAQGMGINVDSGSVQSDISSSSSFLSTSASSSSFSQTTGASSTTGYTGAGGYPAGPGPLTGGAGSVTAGQTSFGQTSGFTSTAGTQGGFGQTTGAQSALISRIANALANTSTLRAVLRAGVSQNVASNVVQRTIQTLASRLGIDGNSLSRVALQAISQIAPGSDTSAYAQALSTALVSGGVLNASNIDTLGSQVLSALLNGVSTAAQGMGINVDSGSVQSDISSSSSFLSTSASSSSFSQTTGASSTTGYTGAGGYPSGPGPLTGGAGSVTAGQTSFGQTSGFTSTAGTQGGFGQTTGAQSALISKIANALANTSTLRAVLRAGVSQNVASNVVQRTIQTLASRLGIDGNSLSRVALQAISQIAPGSDTSAYAQALSTALVSGGVLNASNIDTLGSQVLSALLNGVSTAAQGMGINVDSGSVQSDISSSSSFLSTSASSSSFSQTTGASSTTGYTGAGGYPAGPGPLTGGAGSVTAGQTSFGQTSGFTSTAGTQGGFGQTTGAQSALISKIANALANTSTLRAVLRAGVSQNVASNVVQRTIQTLASRLGIDGNSLSRVALQAISQIAPGSDTSAYAQALSTALVSGGVLNASNIDTLGSQVLSALLNGVSTAAQGMGINVDSGSVQSDISSSSSFLSTSASSSSFSQTTGASSTTGYTGAGGYPAGPGPLTGGAGSVTAGQTSFGQTSGFTSTAGTQGGFGQTTGAQSALISRIANALANTSTLRAVLRAGVSQNVASNVVQRTIQTLASRLGIDGNSLSRVALQAISQIAPGSDTSAYAQALSTALVSGGVLNASNIDTLGSQVLSALLNGVSTAAQGMGINVDSGSVQSDISSSSSFLSTSASSSSFSQTTGASSTTGYTGAGGYPAGPGPLTGGAGSVTAGQTSFGQTSGITSTAGTQGGFGQTTGAQSALISRIANALANTSTLRAVLRAGVSQNVASNVVKRTIQTLASRLGIDGNSLSRVALQAISQIAPGSDTSAYAQALSTALVSGGVLNASNIDTLGFQVLSALLNGVSTAAQGMGINVDSGSVQSDISSSSSFLSTSASSSSFSQTTGASSTTGYTGAGGYPAGPGPLTGGAGSVTAGQTSFGQTSGFTSTAGTQGGFGQTTGAQSALISRITNALANTSTLRAVLRAGVSQNVASNVVQRTIQTLASRLGIDGNSLSRVALQAISQIAPGSDTSAYAQALSTALVSGGVLNASNIDTLGSQVLSALLNGVSTAAQGMGINVDSGSVQSDISSSSSFLSTSASSSSFSQTTGASSTTGYTGAGGYPAGPGPLTGGAGSVTAGQTSFGQTSGFTSTAGTQGGFGQTTGAQSALISRIANALANTSTLRAVLRAGVSQNVASNVVQRTIQTLASRLGIDGNSLSRVALQAISQIAPGSDTSAYAQALSTALVSGGVLNASNIDTLGSQVLSALLNGVSTAAQGMGINVDSGSVQSDISSSSSFLSTSASSSSFSQTTGASSTTGYTGAGGYPAGPGPLTGGAGSVTAGQTSFGQTSGFTSTAGTQGGFGQTTGAQSALISRIANALANTSTLRAVLRAGVSQNVASNVVQRTIQTLASRLGIDGNSLSRVALQAISQIAPGSDTSAYAQALSTALVSGGVLNANNIDTLGSQVLSALLNGVSTAAQGMGINVDSGSVQSDISSSSSFLSTSASSSSFSQTTGASSTTGYTGAGGYPAGPGPLTGGAGSVTAGQTSFGQTSGFTSTAGTQGGFGQTTGAQSALISRIANALANTSTLRAVLRAGVSQNVASNVVQRTIQTLASRLGIDGNTLSRVALQAISQIAPGSDTSAYAQALSTALVSGGVLNASNIDTLGSQVLSALLNGVSTAAQGMGINVDSGSVQSDISSSSSFLSTSASSSSFSQTTGASSTTGYTGAGGYPAGPGLLTGGAGSVTAGQTSFGQASGLTSSASQSDFSQSSGFVSSASSQGSYGQTTGIPSSGGPAVGLSVRSTLNSPIGLRSGSAATRISQLTSSISNAVRPNGVDANALARSLQASLSSLQSSGMSASDAKIEVLLETVVGLLQLLSNTQIRGVNMATASSVANSAARSFELVLA